MKYAVIKTYEVEAKSEKEAEDIIVKLEEKNLQGLFLRFISTKQADRDRPSWKLW